LQLLFFVLLPVIFLARCAYVETTQRSELRALCENSSPGKKLSIDLNEAKKAGFRVRSNFPVSKDKADWFDKEYNRIVKQLKKKSSTSTAYTIIFAKPGLGYYVCIIEHEKDLIVKSRYEDRSS